ncbi:MAG: alpha/beta hydrolase [Gammaproteobacteria bacterium]|nr:alpha/beta hydrolase [Gammaproteobacteria bacterium]
MKSTKFLTRQTKNFQYLITMGLLVIGLSSNNVFGDTVSSVELSSEEPSQVYAENWYRSVRMSTWLWEGADQAVIEATLDRIKRAIGTRRWAHLADTILENGAGHWSYEFSATADQLMSDAFASEAQGNQETARSQFLQASIYYTIASYPHLRDKVSRAALAKAFDAYENAGRHFPVELQNWDFIVDGVAFRAYLHLPKSPGDEPMPLVLKTGGMDVLSTEFYPLYDHFSQRGIALIVFDMPGTGNEGVVDENADKHHSAVLERARKDPRFDAERIALWSESLAGMPAVKMAITHQHKLAAVVNSCGLVHATHVQEFGEVPSADEVLSAYLNGQLSESEIEAANQQLSTPARRTIAESFQYEVYVDRVRAKPGSLIDLLSKSHRVSLKVQGLLDAGVVTEVPILTTNTHVDQLVPLSESLMVTDASRRGTLILFGEHEGHCVDQKLEVPVVVGWLARALTSAN